ncbi:MAG TPA: glucosamine-6-phosphate isomerase [Ruminiclostridium sp.]|nr:glucosamine-6-phosphate isomerase [Ruminiclostridium sp.]
MDMISTIKGTLFETLYPKGWELERVKYCVTQDPATICDRQDFWHSEFKPVPVKDLNSLAVQFGHEIAMQIRKAKEESRELVLILPVGPMEMYQWVVYFLQEWGITCEHVHGFMMDEWSDAEGNTLPASNPVSFQYAINKAFYGPLGKNGIPEKQRHYATKDVLPHYSEIMGELRSKGAKQVMVYGVGRACHIAFWDPHFALDYAKVEDWLSATHRVGAMLHPLTIEQNAYLTFHGNYIPMTCYANTIGPGIMFKSDFAIGGCDGVLGRGMSWQGQTLWLTLRYGKNPWITSSFIPTIPGKMLFLEELAGSCAEINPH